MRTAMKRDDVIKLVAIAVCFYMVWFNLHH
jgi:hypothetical protein